MPFLEVERSEIPKESRIKFFKNNTEFHEETKVFYCAPKKLINKNMNTIYFDGGWVIATRSAEIGFFDSKGLAEEILVKLILLGDDDNILEVVKKELNRLQSS